MVKRSLVLLSLLTILAVPAAYAETYGAVMTSSQETPPLTTGGFGNATVVLDAAHTSVTVNMTISGLSTPVNNAHIHRGAFGVSGPVLINFNPATNLANGRLNATFAIEKAIGDEIAGNPSNFYVNVHTTQNGGGEIRGNLTLLGDATVLFAELRGTNEVPANASTVVGSSLVTIDNSNMVTYEVNAGGIVSPTLSHIHKNVAGANGSVVVNFALAASAFTNGRVKGTIQIDPALAADIKANPSGYYVNVHSTAFGGGEVRGQLAAANEYDVAIAGNVTTGAGDKFVTDLRVFNPSFTEKAVVLVEYLLSGSAANANATASKTLEINARGEAVLDDVTGTNQLNSVGSTGALRVSSNKQLAVTSNIYNDQRGANKGTFGQFVPAVNRSNALRRGVIPHLANKTRDAANPSGFRTNIGLFNPNQSSVLVRLELRDGAGTLLGSTTLNLAGWSQQQNAITSYFGSANIGDASALTVSFDAGAPILVYGAVNDNVSGDSIFVEAQPDSGVAASQP